MLQFASEYVVIAVELNGQTEWNAWDQMLSVQGNSSQRWEGRDECKTGAERSILSV